MLDRIWYNIVWLYKLIFSRNKENLLWEAAGFGRTGYTFINILAGGDREKYKDVIEMAIEEILWYGDGNGILNALIYKTRQPVQYCAESLYRFSNFIRGL